jgi:hypothetical protein
LPSDTYTVTPSTGVQNSYTISLANAYTWNFTVDRTAPTVVSTSPVNSATGVGAMPTITVTFSEEMDPTTVGLWYYFSVRNHSGGLIGGRVTYENKTATYSTQGQILERGTTYTATVGNGARDLAGNGLPADYTWSFTIDSGSFLPAVSSALTPGSWPEAVAIGDINGDGRNDVVVTCMGGFASRPRIALFTQSAQGGLNPAVSYDSYDYPLSIQTADIDGDGVKDVIVRHRSSSAVGVYLRQPDGTLSAENLYSGSGDFFYPGSMAIGDINGDGLSDIVMATYYGSIVVLYHTPR